MLGKLQSGNVSTRSSCLEQEPCQGQAESFGRWTLRPSLRRSPVSLTVIHMVQLGSLGAVASAKGPCPLLTSSKASSMFQPKLNALLSKGFALFSQIL